MVFTSVITLEKERKTLNSQYEELTAIKNIEPKVWKEEYEVKGMEYKNGKRDSDLVIEENTIYEIDMECIECRKK